MLPQKKERKRVRTASFRKHHEGVEGAEGMTPGVLTLAGHRWLPAPPRPAVESPASLEDGIAAESLESLERKGELPSTRDLATSPASIFTS